MNEYITDNIPDINDLQIVNDTIKSLKCIYNIPGFGLEIIKDCASALIAGRSIVFDDFVDWDFIANGR